MKRNILDRAWVYKVSIFISGILPLRLTRIISRSIAFLGYLVLKEMRGNVEKNLSHIYDDRRKVKAAARKIFINYGEYLADWAKLNHMDPKKIMDLFSFVKGEDVIKEGLRRGKGIVLLTAHLGNWELGGLFFGHLGVPINVVTARDAFKGVANVREKTRKLHNVNTITIEKNSMFIIDIINALRRNEMVAMLTDRYTEENGVFVDFFGKPALFPSGPIMLAKSTGAVIVPALIMKGRGGKYKGIADSIVELEFTGDKQKDAVENMGKIVKILEKYILEYADQWYNFTYLWNTPKDQDRGLKCRNA